MIYVPDTENYECFVIRSEEVIRAYEQTPTNNSEINYRDYYYNANYYYNDGTQSFSSYTTLPTCLDSSVLTTDVYYRNDLDSILTIFLVMAIFMFYLPFKVFYAFIKRRN